MSNIFYKVFVLGFMLTPLMLLLLLINDFIHRYENLVPQLADAMEQSYLVGCSDAGYPDISECRTKAIKFVQQIRNWK